MIDRLGTAIVSALFKALTVVVLFVLLVGLVTWAQANPEEWKSAAASVAGTVVRLVVWACNQIAGALPS